MADTSPERESRARRWGVKIASVAILSALRVFLLLVLIGLVLSFFALLLAALFVGNLFGYLLVGFVGVLVAIDVYALILIQKKIRSIVRKK